MGERIYFDDVTCLAESDRAIRVEIEGDQAVWIPKSQVDDESEVKAPGDEGRLVVTKYIVEQRELDGGLDYDG